MLNRRITLAIGIAILGLCAANTSAAFIQLTDTYYIDELPGGELTVFDKVFSDFEVITTVRDPLGSLGNPPDASSIQVMGVEVDWGSGPEWGLRFFGGWSVMGQEYVDTTIIYRLKISDRYPDWWITDNTLKLTMGNGANGGQASITETVYEDYPQTPVAQKYVFSHENSHVDDLEAHVDFDQPYKELWIGKDVLVNGGPDPAGSAMISEFWQTYSQIPEPATIALLAVGGVVLIAHRRRRRS